MEAVLDVYERAYNEEHPVVGLDESPKQLIAEVRPGFTDSKGVVYHDFEYKREGVADLYMVCEPLAGKRRVFVKENHNRLNWAEVIRVIAEEMYPTKENLIEIKIDGQKKVPFYKRLLGKNSIEYKPVGNELLTNITSEEFILKLSDDRETAKRVVAEEVEITLRRWFVQLNPKLAQDHSFPPVLNKFVFEKIGELIPQKINRLVKQDNLEPSWKAFQRSHLQAILEQVNNLDNGLSEDDRKLLRPLGDVLSKLSENEELLKNLADGTLTILSRVGESEENIKKCIAEERDKLQIWLELKLDEILAVGKRTEANTEEIKEGVKRIEAKLTQVVAPEKEGIELCLVSLPDLKDNIYGRDNEIKEILKFLRNEPKHGAIVLPTCFGKTSLIKKLLKETTDANQVNDKYHELFEKIIYIFCYQNQNFQQIIKPFASLMGKKLKYTKGNEANYLRQDVFDKIQNQKILLIIDNFESWIDENDKYLNNDVRVFLETLFSSNHQIHTVFVSQKLPHTEKDFRKKVEEIKEIEKALLKGLDEKSALELVRTEGDDEDFKYVSDDDLRDFFKKVFYIPQAIQSMLWFIDSEGISFSDFMNDEWNSFQTAESDLTDIEKHIPKELRPTRALLVHQIGKLDENSVHLLCLTAFFDGIVPEEILLADFGKYKKNELRKPLDRLKKHQLILTETDALPETDETTGIKSAIHYYQLHGFVRNIIQTMFPDFAANNLTDLIAIADQMDGNQINAWEKKLFDKQLALVECWERLENYLVVDRKMSDRQYYLDLIDFKKALAQQETTFAVNQSLSSDEITVRVKNIEKLYLRWLEKYPNDADAYNNLGNLLGKGESRWMEAEAAYRKAIELNPNVADAYYNLGNLLARQEKELASAEHYFRTAIKLNSQFIMAYSSLAALKALYGNENDKDEIFELLRKLIELDELQIELVKQFAEVDFIRDDVRFAEIVGGDDGE